MIDKTICHPFEGFHINNCECFKESESGDGYLLLSIVSIFVAIAIGLWAGYSIRKNSETEKLRSNISVMVDNNDRLIKRAKAVGYQQGWDACQEQF